MKTVTFVTGNGWRHDEAKRLLSGLHVKRARITLAKGDSDKLEEIAEARVLDAFRQLETPCFIENTGMYLESSEAFAGAQVKQLLQELGPAAFCARFGGLRGVTRVVVAYTADGRSVKLFAGENSGSVAKGPRGEQGYGWDPVWIPDGFERTLAELRSSKYVVNMRLLPFLELAAELRGTGFEGVFESHVTVAACDEAAFARTCDALGVRALFISLPRGRTPRQPMTGAHHRGSLQEVLLVVHQLARDLAQAGFEVIRTKVEAVGPHRDLPLTDDVAARAPRTNYFEHHAKVVLPSPDSEAEVSRAFAELGAYLSRGAPRADGIELRFVTLRSWGLGQASADARFDQVLALAARLGLPLRNRTREYTVYDSALDVDTGWMA
ncbi:non-canonical purine NTP pyrophosphatase [Sorangium sp. So ce726]|uniref:non-canonical purine NTP pyrophosphatase n=1 Tax=Sorangium sp. So ce726 TaxID=3133319 RepID=UPI003F5F78D2